MKPKMSKYGINMRYNAITQSMELIRPSYFKKFGKKKLLIKSDRIHSQRCQS